MVASSSLFTLSNSARRAGGSSEAETGRGGGEVGRGRRERQVGDGADSDREDNHGNGLHGAGMKVDDDGNGAMLTTGFDEGSVGGEDTTTPLPKKAKHVLGQEQ